jgi:hypothetical protein
MPKSMLLWTTRMPANGASARVDFVRFFRLNGWLTLLIAVPLIIAVTLLAIFFFAAFLGLFVAVLAVAALRVWWLRRQMRLHDGARRLTTTEQLPHSKPKF